MNEYRTIWWVPGGKLLYIVFIFSSLLSSLFCELFPVKHLSLEEVLPH
jgi:hypothetical protein